jgi:hypothetical protein
MNDNKIQAMIESFKSSNLTESQSVSKYKFPGMYCPYFTPNEVASYTGYYSDHIDEECVSLYEEAININTHHTPDHAFQKSWNSKVGELHDKLKNTEDQDEIDQIKQDMISLGWNPEIEYNTENQIMAKKRFENIMNEMYNRVFISNITPLVESFNDEYIEESTSSKKKLFPVHIVLVRGCSPLSKLITSVTPGEFSHSAISLDNKLEKLYSYNFDNKFNFGGGFSLESIKEYPKENRLAVYTVFVTENAYKKISDNIQYLLGDIKNTTYSIVNLITFPIKNININMGENMICSQFVDSILKLANTDFTKKDSSKVSPNELNFALSNNPKAYKIFDGVVKDFDGNKTNKFINKISKTATSANESCKYENAIFEARKIPVEVSSEGDVLLTNPFPDYSEEYFSSHKLLLNYEKTGNIDGMKYELARLYYMNYTLEKKLYHNKLLPKKNEYIKTRARILNDFNKYLKYVLDKDKKFNFGEYYEQSPFYANTIEVKGSTIGQVKDIIKYIL